MQKDKCGLRIMMREQLTLILHLMYTAPRKKNNKGEYLSEQDLW